MKRAAVLLFIGVFSSAVYSQKLVSPMVGKDRVPDAELIRIVNAEDSRNAEPVISMLTNANSAVRYRAALAAGRIGDERALDGLIKLLADESIEVREMAAFAIGEVESLKGADAILDRLKRALEKDPEALVPGRVMPLWPELIFPNVLSRVVEAAGKIAAANANTPKAKELGAAILNVLNAFANDKNLGRSILRGAPEGPRTRMILLGLTAVLRTRPEGAADVVAKFFSDPDPRIRADAGNTLARLRAKNANETLRKMVASEPDAVARANAARVLGAAEDKDAVDLLVNAATHDADARVRVSAIRSLAALKDAKAAAPLIASGEMLLASYKVSKQPHPTESAELLEIANALGRILAGTKNEWATKFLFDLAAADNGFSSDAIIARMKVSPGTFADKAKFISNWHQYSTIAQAMGAFADSEGGTPQGVQVKAAAPGTLREIVSSFNHPLPKAERFKLLAAPDFIQAFAAYKTADLSEVMRASLENNDVFIRAAAAGVLADQPSSPANIEALKVAFGKARINDLHDDDAMLAILDALFKLDKRASAPILLNALTATDYLVRKKALTLLADPELQKLPGIAEATRIARQKPTDRVLPYDPKSGTKLGQVLNKEADYVRALSRKNGSVKAVLTTSKGVFSIVFNPEEAPLTVDNFVKLARTGYFNGLEVHRVVPNFVMQDGDPRGDGNGGPGWSIRCEINMLPYDRGAVGMALSGKDTGGSQWFVTHSPQPHLDGGYTVFGHVSEADMKVVDRIVRGDKILSVAIIGR